MKTKASNRWKRVKELAFGCTLVFIIPLSVLALLAYAAYIVVSWIVINW